MDFRISDEQQLLRRTVADIARDILAPEAAEIDQKCGFPRRGLRSLADAGILGLLVPPAHGGAGADTVTFALASEEIARACANTALIFVTHGAACAGLAGFATEALKKKHLPALASGKALGAFAATESNSGANPLAVETKAALQDGRYVVNGSKVFITAGGEADVYLTLVRTGQAPGPAALSLLCIEKGAPGFSFGRLHYRLGFNGTSCRELLFEGCPVPQDHLVGQEGGYMMAAMPIMGVALVGAAALAVGIAQAALDDSLRHAKERVVAGQPIGRYQGIQFLVSEMSANVEAARALVHLAAFRRDSGPPGPPLDAFKAKLFATEMAQQVTSQALQVHGGQGYTRELPIERYFRDARGLTLHFGPSEALKETLGKMLLGMFP